MEEKKEIEAVKPICLAHFVSGLPDFLRTTYQNGENIPK
jgi:hypothetical protein